MTAPGHRPLRPIAPPAPARPPVADRGALLYVPELATRLGKSEWWVRHNVPKTHALKIGRTLAWFEADIDSWLETLTTGEGT